MNAQVKQKYLSIIVNGKKIFFVINGTRYNFRAKFCKFKNVFIIIEIFPDQDN